MKKYKHDVKIELEEINKFLKLNKNTQKLITLLKFNNYNIKIISDIIKNLQNKYTNINIFRAYKLEYPEEYKINILKIKYYENNSYSSMI
tara:strand:- start:2504 stop:2773 length:270 start_codon:yes stop_codon:yes gene_type:complete